MVYEKERIRRHNNQSNSQKILHFIDKQIEFFREIFFETFGEIDIPIGNADDVPSKNATLTSVLLKRRTNKTF